MRHLNICTFALLLALAGCTGTLEAESGNPDGSASRSPSDAGSTADAGASLDASAPPPSGPTCGDGIAERGETCDGDCPVACDDGNACTDDVMTGSAATCNVVCDAQPIEACTDGDGCCPSGCDSGNDNDCSATCGNDVVDDGETCDPASSCPIGCDDGQACTRDVMTGSVDNCNVACSSVAITSCVDGDGCCPGSCDETLDNDCEADCGNGVVETGEVCDGNCPNCNDGNSCTVDSTTGTPGTCDVVCSNDPITMCADGDGCCPSACNANNDDDCGAVCGNGTREAGEICDGDCPTSCDDSNACTADSLVGMASSCNAECINDPIAMCASGDGCCPANCDATNDNDCQPMCGNSVVEPGETCDGNCPSCDDGNACTADVTTGSTGTCDVACTNNAITMCTNGDGCCPMGCDQTNDDDCAPMCGNGRVESGETCDGNCPMGCNDSDVCTADSSSGSAMNCDLACTNSAITSCTDGDGCCPGGCNANNDDDCAIDCTNAASWPVSWADYETEVIRLVNIERAAGADCGSRGMFAAAGAVTMDTALRQAARCHSGDMANNDFFSHTGTGGTSFSQRCNGAGYTGIPLGENIAAGHSTPAAVVTGWMISDGHCANIMKSSVTEIGLGYYTRSGSTWTRYWTMVTGR